MGQSSVDVNVKGGSLTAASGVSSVGDGRKTVTTAGTRVQISSSSVPAKKVLITALDSNTDVVVVGGITVVAASGTRTGRPLSPGENTGWFDISDLNTLYLDSLVNGEGVSFIYTV